MEKSLNEMPLAFDATHTLVQGFVQGAVPMAIAAFFLVMLVSVFR